MTNVILFSIRSQISTKRRPKRLAARIPVNNRIDKAKMMPKPGMDNPSKATGCHSGGNSSMVLSSKSITSLTITTVAANGSQTRSTAMMYFFNEDL